MGRVLVVDDVLDNITLLSFDLEDDGFEVITASGGAACLEQARKLPRPDIILLDIQMPGMGGIDTLRQLKESTQTADIPVIMVSANDSDEVIVECIDLGAHDFVSKPIVYPVLAARMRSALRLSQALNDLERANTELNKLATTDPLTGAYNRRHFFTLSKVEVAKAQRYDRPITLMMIDIDHFKQINDNHGHSVGDTALRAVVECCREASRSSDIFGRLGGEEFAICCADTERVGAFQLAERIRCNCMQLEIAGEKENFNLSVSIGLAEIEKDEKLESALQRADKCLYLAKERGRNQTVVEDD